MSRTLDHVTAILAEPERVKREQLLSQVPRHLRSAVEEGVRKLWSQRGTIRRSVKSGKERSR